MSLSFKSLIPYKPTFGRMRATVYYYQIYDIYKKKSEYGNSKFLGEASFSKDDFIANNNTYILEDEKAVQVLTTFENFAKLISSKKTALRVEFLDASMDIESRYFLEVEKATLFKNSKTFRRFDFSKLLDLYNTYIIQALEFGLSNKYNELEIISLIKHFGYFGDGLFVELDLGFTIFYSFSDEVI